MKTSFKLMLLAAAISLSAIACKGNRSATSGDTAKVDSSTSVKNDSTVKIDTAKPATDTTKKDTISKTTTKTTVTKKTEIKKKQ